MFPSYTFDHGVVRVRIGPTIIVANRQQLKQGVLDMLESGARRFVFDLAETGYVDTSGLGVLVTLSKRIRERGGSLTLEGLNDDLVELFEHTQLDTLFEIRRASSAAQGAPR